MARKTFRKVITTPEKIEMIESSNKKLVERFLRYMSQTKSEGTIKVYKSNFDIFFCWNLDYNDNKPFEKIKKIEMQDFFAFCTEELQYSPNRFAQMHSSLSSLSTYIENQLDEIERYENFRNIVTKIEKPVKEPVREKTIISPEQIDKLTLELRKESKKDPYRFQEALYIVLSVSAGTRLNETLRITTDLIDEKETAFDDLFLVTKKQIRTKGRGRTGKMLYKYIIKDLFLPWYKEWLPIRAKIMKENSVDEHNAIFIKRNGEPIKTNSVNIWTQRWTEMLGIDIYPHSFRHYFVTYLSRIGLEAELIQSIVGWTSSDMVAVYNDMRIDERQWKGLGKLAEALKETNTMKGRTAKKKKQK